MAEVTLLDLEDALLDRIVSQLATTEGARGTIQATCLVNKRFAALLKQPLVAWGCVKARVRLDERKPYSRVALTQWTQWMVAVAPAVRQLYIDANDKFETGMPYGPEDEDGEPCYQEQCFHFVDAAAFLLPMAGLQVNIRGPLH